MDSLTRVVYVARRAFTLFVTLVLVYLTERTGPARLRRALLRVGGPSSAMGEYLTMRSDVISAEYLRELLALKYHKQQIPLEDVDTIFIESVGRSIGDTFRAFNHNPVSVSFFSQIHTAELNTGEQVIVKIVRPSAREILAREIPFLEFIAGVIQFFGIVRPENGYVFIADFVSWAMRETDVRHEAENGIALARHTEYIQQSSVPLVYSEFSRSSVLVLEYIGGGILLDDYTKKSETDDTDMAHFIVADVVQQYIHTGVFHAHLHGEHIVIFPNERRVVYLDQSTIFGSGSPNERTGVARILAGLANRDHDELAVALFSLAEPIFKSELGHYLYADVRKRKKGNAVFAIIKKALITDLSCDVATALGEHTDAQHIFRALQMVTRKYGIQLPKPFNILFRALGTLDVVLAPRFPGYTFIGALNYSFKHYPYAETESYLNKTIEEIAYDDNSELENENSWELARERVMVEREEMIQNNERALERIAYLAETYEGVRTALSEFRNLKF